MKTKNTKFRKVLVSTDGDDDNGVRQTVHTLRLRQQTLSLFQGFLAFKIISKDFSLQSSSSKEEKKLQMTKLSFCRVLGIVSCFFNAVDLTTTMQR